MGGEVHVAVEASYRRPAHDRVYWDIPCRYNHKQNGISTLLFVRQIVACYCLYFGRKYWFGQSTKGK